MLLIPLIPNVSDLVITTDFDPKILHIQANYFTTPDYDRFTEEIINKEKGLVDKFDISGFIDNSDLDKKIATLATKAELKAEQGK